MAHIVAPADPAYDSQFAAVGRLVDKWAQLEFAIDQAIWQLANVEQMLGACITAQLIGVNGRLQALRSLLQARGASEPTIKKVGTFAGSLSTLQNDRHRAAHDPRMVHTATGNLERLQITAKNQVVFGFQPEDVDSLSATTAQIAAKVVEFGELFTAITAELNALPDTAQPTLRKIVPVKKDASDQTTTAAPPENPLSPPR
jgi:hypothetical protein